MATQDLAATGAGAAARQQLVAARPRYGERIVKAFLLFCGALSVLITISIVLALLFGSVEFLRQVPIQNFLLGTDWAPGFEPPSFGVIPIVVGTLNIAFWAMVVSVPIGLLCAIYLSEYASNRIRRIVKPVLEMLEGIPTVAIGLWALFFLRPLFEDLFPFLEWRTPHSVGVAGVAVGLLVIPLVASVSDDAMRAVPAGLREGAYALGATKLKVSLRVVFPAAVSGVIASFVLAMSRAVGETMVVLLAAGASANLTIVPTESVQVMTAFIGRTAFGEASQGSLDYYTLFAVGMLLFLMTLVMNLFAIRLVRRFREVYE